MSDRGKRCCVALTQSRARQWSASHAAKRGPRPEPHPEPVSSTRAHLPLASLDTRGSTRHTHAPDWDELATQTAPALDPLLPSERDNRSPRPKARQRSGSAARAELPAVVPDRNHLPPLGLIRATDHLSVQVQGRDQYQHAARERERGCRSKRCGFPAARRVADRRQLVLARRLPLGPERGQGQDDPPRAQGAHDGGDVLLLWDPVEVPEGRGELPVRRVCGRRRGG